MIIGMVASGGGRVDVGRSLHTGHNDVAHVAKSRHGHHFQCYAPLVVGRGEDFYQAFVDLIGRLGAV